MSAPPYVAQRSVGTAAAPWARQRFMWAGQATQRQGRRSVVDGGARAGQAAQQRGVGAAAARRGAAGAPRQVAGQVARMRGAGAAAARSVAADTRRIRSGEARARWVACGRSLSELPSCEGDGEDERGGGPLRCRVPGIAW